MLQVLSHCGIGEVSVVVCRYFGGTKLGTGGLVKAYTDAVKLVVEACPRQTKRQLKHISLACPYDLMGRIEHLCQRHDAVIQQRDYGDSLTLALLIPVENIPALEQDLGPLAHAYIMPAL